MSILNLISVYHSATRSFARLSEQSLHFLEHSGLCTNPLAAETGVEPVTLGNDPSRYQLLHSANLTAIAVVQTIRVCIVSIEIFIPT